MTIHENDEERERSGSLPRSAPWVEVGRSTLLNPGYDTKHYGDGISLPMAKDYRRRWRVGSLTLHVHTRFGRAKSLPRMQFGMCRGNALCYCRSGVNIDLHHFNRWLWLCVDWTERPCWCDRAMDEIESDNERVQEAAHS